ncbi:anti-sigma factor family protein [Ideonella sp. YS5]|uniref:anti-sigma factor family protein n=1 Tax=Ideonella sp. YS5 TaxID=3453714 RepID=UPI003EEE4A36
MTNDHLRAWEALPWVANGRATPEQSAMVAEHVARCPDCQAELDWQKRLHAAMSTGAVPGEDDIEVEAGLQRLMARLDDPGERQPLPTPPRSAGRLTWALAAAVVVQAVGLGVMGLQLGRFGGDPGSGGDYRTLSDPPAATPAATLRVLPDPSMTLSAWQATLAAQGLQVVAGPNAAGAYALAPAPADTTTPVRPAAEVLARLRATAGIRLAEPMGDAP